MSEGDCPPPEQNEPAGPSNADDEAIFARAQANSTPPSSEDDKINDDERPRFNWETRYPRHIIIRIRCEAAYVTLVFALALVGILLTWRGDLAIWLDCKGYALRTATLNRYAYMVFAGVLGGSLFGLKYLYKVAARGYWNEDRELWRVLSPLLAGGFAFAVGALANAGLFGFDVNHSHGGASFVSLGFIAGYFGDSASRKMQEIADILFGQAHAVRRDKTPAK